MYDDLLQESGAALAYGGVGIALLAFGYLVVDLLTPGRLGHAIWSRDGGGLGGAVVLAAKLLGVGAIVTTAICTSEDGLTAGLLSTAVYGLLGIVLSTAAFFVLDLLTPGRLGEAVLSGEGKPHAACWVVAAMDLATAAIVAAAIS